MYFVTGDSVDSASPLYKLVNGDPDRTSIFKLMMDEANRLLMQDQKRLLIKPINYRMRRKYMAVMHLWS